MPVAARDSRGRRRVAPAAVCAGLLVAIVLALPCRAPAQEAQRRVLVLYSAGRDAQISIAGDRDLPRLLDQRLASRLDYYSEYLDAGRFPDPAYQAGMRDFLSLKYGALRFDLVVAMLDVAFDFLRVYRDELFPDTPVVFFTRDPLKQRMPNSTGAVEEANYSGTIHFAAAVQPETERVFVVSGAGERDKRLLRLARPQLDALESRLAFTYLSGLPTRDLEQRLAALPPRSIIYYLLVYQDGTGESFQPLDYLARLAAVANRPTYSWIDTAMGRGVVGGNMQSLSGMIEAVANLSLRVLAGEPADSIPIPTLELESYQADWRQLRRWGISGERVPPKTTILFREFGIWERYKGYILIACALLLAQTVLIAGLLVQAARRRRAEEQVHRSQEELRRNSERIQDLAGRLLRAQESERARIARELHDDINQQLALLSMDLQMLSGFGEGDDEVERLAREALDRTDGIVRGIRNLSHRLHPARLRLIGVVPAISGLLREISQPSFEVAFAHEDVPASLPEEITICIYRVLQEALQNAMKHSRGSRVSITLKRTGDRLALTISDDGSGFDVKAKWGTGLGLASMSERVDSIGGRLAIRSSPAAGTTLDVVIPLQWPQVPAQIAV